MRFDDEGFAVKRRGLLAVALVATVIWIFLNTGVVHRVDNLRVE